MGLYEQVQETVAAISAKSGGQRPAVAVILGSGLGAFADSLTERVALPYAQLPHFPRSSVPGHAGQLVLGRIGETRVAAMQGRVHYYEGYSPEQVAFPARVLCALGIRALMVTNAAGGIQPGLRPADLMVITDHINLAGWNALVGANDDRLGPRFPDMSAAYHPSLRTQLLLCAQQLDIPLKQGVYAMLAGPSYETPAEIRALRALGADAVGMSTVPEVVAAAHMGVPVVGISCITNLAAGIGSKPLSHEEVGDTARKVNATFSRLLAGFLPIAARV